MNSPLLLILLFVTLDGCAALFGGLIPRRLLQERRGVFLAFATAMIFGVALLEMLPKALEGGTGAQALFETATGGFCLFFLLEALFGHHRIGRSELRHRTIGPSLLLGDALHNVADGVAVAAAFLSDPRLGITTAVAVFLHELPQETGDFAVLVELGYSRKKALLALFIVQLTALAGALGVYFAFQWVHPLIPRLLAFSAGGFIYIAAVDLMPDLFRGVESRKELTLRLLSFFFGMLVVVAMGRLLD